MKGGSVGPAACVGCWGFSVGPLVLVLVLSTPSALGLDFEASRTSFSAGLCPAAVDVWVFKVGVCVARVCSCRAVSSGWRLEAGGGRVRWSLLLFLSRGSSESRRPLQKTEQDFGGEPGKSLLKINQPKPFLSNFQHVTHEVRCSLLKE